MKSKELVEIIKTSNKNVIVYCAAAQGEYAYALLVACGVSIVSFCDNDPLKAGIKIVDVPVLPYEECKQKYQESIYIVANAEYYKGALIGKQLEKEGYIFESTYFLFQEIQWAEHKPLFFNLFSNKEIILQGSLLLCQMMRKWLLSTIPIHESDLYLCSKEEEIEQMLATHREAIWVLLDKPAISGSRRNIWNFINQNRIENVCQYFSKNYIYCNATEEEAEKEMSSSNSELTVAEKINKVVLIGDSGCCGSFLVQSLFDSHPNILYLGWNRFSFDIWRYVTLAGKQSITNVLSFILEQLEQDYLDMKEEMPKELASVLYSEEYKDRFHSYTQQKKKVTERELLIYLYLAYHETLHGTYVSAVVPAIYIDIHTDNIDEQEVGLRWFSDMGLQVILLKMIRNPIIRLGSYFKFRIAQIGEIGAKKVYEWFQRCGEEQKFEVRENVEVYRIRFEDLKLHPKEILLGLCELIEIPWNDILLETTSGNEKSIYTYSKESITGFSQKPVYYQYDEYFNSFDKFRLDFLFGAKAKSYGYPFLNPTCYAFSKEQILEWFQYPFQFEKYLYFNGESEREQFRGNLYATCKFLLDRIWKLKEYPNDFDFGDYRRIISK